MSFSEPCDGHGEVATPVPVITGALKLNHKWQLVWFVGSRSLHPIAGQQRQLLCFTVSKINSYVAMATCILDLVLIRGSLVQIRFTYLVFSPGETRTKLNIAKRNHCVPRVKETFIG